MFTGSLTICESRSENEFPYSIILELRTEGRLLLLLYQGNSSLSSCHLFSAVSKNHRRRKFKNRVVRTVATRWLITQETDFCEEKTKDLGLAMVQTFSSRFLSIEAPFRYQTTPCRISCGKSGTETFLSAFFPLPL